ncbi:MAG: FAD-dependent oxidoreductase [Thermodesulfobacteriota bacterium]
MRKKKVLIVGAGVSGLSAALDLADFGIKVDLVDSSDFPGGQTVRLSCKAIESCVNCGACIIEEKLNQVRQFPSIRLMPRTRIKSIRKDGTFKAELQHKPVFIDPVRCNACGLCLEKCPVNGGILQGSSTHHIPFFAVSEKRCVFLKDRSCRICEEVCPEKAIHLEAVETFESVEADAVVLACGFNVFNPEQKYGYKLFKNTMTSLELEDMVRRQGRVSLPWNGQDPGRIAFIQCVGSRDEKIKHLWCSKYCCGFALRMADRITSRQPDVEITVFYIDFQTIGNNFESFLSMLKKKIRMIRIIPGDVFPGERDRLKLTYVDNRTSESVQEEFDLIVLSVGMEPREGVEEMISSLGIDRERSGFIDAETSEKGSSLGLFFTGSVTGPMTIAESMADAGKCAWEVLNYFKGRCLGK